MTLFGTAGIRGRVGDAITPALATSVGRAVGASADEVVVGRDGRTTGQGLADALVAGLLSAATDVQRLGVVPTPALAYASRGRHGVMVTASHNPPADNGLKLFADGVEYDREREATIADRVAESASATAWNAWGTADTATVLPAYRDAVVDYAEDHGAAPNSLAVAVDCGTGTAGLVTPQVLTSLGARVHALNATVDGHFPARDSKPTPESLSECRAYVADADVDLGLAHDGDGDRLVVLDGDGDVVHEDTVLAILAEHYTAESDAADPVVVTTPNASGRIDERVRSAGGRVQRVRLGALHEGVADVQAGADAGTAVVFAAEPWKHLHPAFGGWIDAVVSAAVLTRLVAAEALPARRREVTERPYRKRSVQCPDERKAPAMDRLAAALPSQFPEAAVDTSHGLRLEFPDGGWVLVRPSGTEPKLRIYAESESVDELVAAVSSAVRSAIPD